MLYNWIRQLSEQKIELPDDHATEKCSENMKKDAGANLVAGGEGLLNKHDDEHRQNGEYVLDEDEHPWSMAAEIPHHRIKFLGPLG